MTTILKHAPKVKRQSELTEMGTKNSLQIDAEYVVDLEEYR